MQAATQTRDCGSHAQRLALAKEMQKRRDKSRHQIDGVTTTGFTYLGLGEGRSFNTLAVPVDKLILQTLKGDWKSLSLAGLMDGEPAESLHLARVFV